MSLYTKARKHIDMNRVKELHEEKIKLKKIANKIREEIREELRYLNNPKFSNWRDEECDLDEGMTSAGVFQTTLPSTGDVDLINVEVSNADTWISSSGGTTVSGSGLNFDQRPSNIYSSSWYLSNLTTEFDATQVNNLKVTVTTGTGVDTPFAANPLTVEWFSDTDYGVLGTFSAGGGTKVFTLPKGANVKNLALFYSVSGNGTSYRTYTDGYLVGQNIYGGAMDSDMSQSAMGILDAGATPNTSPSYPTVDDVKALYGFGFWIDALPESRITALKNGSISGPMPPSWGGTVPSHVVSYGFNTQDQIDIYNQIHNLYSSYDTRASNLYTVNTTSFQRRTPMNVFVGLDSPEAASLIRSEPIMAGLSAEQRKKKLMDMLDAGDEYLLKQLGIVGSSARPSDTTMPDSWEQASGNPVTGGQPGYHSPGSTSPSGAARSDKNMTWDNHMKMYVPNIGIQDMLKKADAGSGDTEIAAAGVPRNTGGSSSGDPNNIQWPRDKYPNKKAPPGPGARTANVPGTKDYGNVAATYGGQSAADQKAVDAWKKKNLIPGRGQNPYRPGTKKLFNPQTGMNLSAHHDPQGETIMEKKKKSFKNLTSKIPGYYEGKPAPLGFPMEEPPKMKDGFHPDLVTSKGQEKKSNRFNRLDPQSAKAMPPTGNPHIDKKVRAAAKKPK